MKTHSKDCNWEKTTSEECEYRQTHYYCPHDGTHGMPDHRCTCNEMEENSNDTQLKEQEISSIIKYLLYWKGEDPRYEKELLEDVTKEMLSLFHAQQTQQLQELKREVKGLKNTLVRHFEYRGVLNGLDVYGKIEMDNKINDILSLIEQMGKED